MLRTEPVTGSVLLVLSFTMATSILPIVTGTQFHGGNRAYVARSPVDSGVHFDTLCVIDKEDMDAESLEVRLWT